MKIHIKTYGCQMNERDSEAVAALLERHGYALTADEDDADVILVNTCSVREKAEAKAIGKLGMLAATKRQAPERIVGAMGCMVQRLKYGIFDQVRGLDFAVGTRRLSSLPGIIETVRRGHTRVLDVSGEENDPASLGGHAALGVSAFVNILFGCNRRCSYCIVPDVRGPEWSRPASDIIEEVRGLARSGTREVTLLGQSVMSYGRTNSVWDSAHVSPRGFTEPLPMLLEALAQIEGLERLRFTSGHPSGCTMELARAIAEVPPVCEHLHLPAQSGSDRILGLMRREYTADEYRAAVARLRAASPDMAITTDIIVGFPTETVEDFEQTLRLMRDIQFDNAFIFKYSARPGTPAALMADDVPADEKQRRNQLVLEEQDRIGLARNSALIGEDVEVLVEGPSLRNPSRLAGRTRANMTAIFEPADSVVQNRVCWVRVDRAMAQTLYGMARADRALSMESAAPAARETESPAEEEGLVHV